MSTFNDHVTGNYSESGEHNVSVVTNEHYAVEKVTVTSGSGTQQTITGGETVEGSLNAGLKRATASNPVEFTASTNNDYYITGKRIRYKVETTVDSTNCTDCGTIGNGGNVNEDGSITVTAIPKSPCTLNNITLDNNAKANSSLTGNSIVLTDVGYVNDSYENAGDITLTATFDCVSAVSSPNGNIVVGGTVVWQELTDINVPNDRCCVLYQYPASSAQINTARNVCSGTYFKSYQAYYKEVEGIPYYRCIYHARGWQGGESVGKKYIAPQFGNNTTSGGLPVAGEVMYFDSEDHLESCKIVTTIPTINSTNGYGCPTDSQNYSSGNTYYTQDGNPNLQQFLYSIGPGSSYGMYFSGGYMLDNISSIYRGVSTRWSVGNGHYNYPRSTWIAITAKNNRLYLDNRFFDVTDLNGNPLIAGITDVNDLLYSQTSLLTKEQPVWFELEYKVQGYQTLSGSDYLPIYFDGDVSFSGTYINKLRGNYVTDVDPEYIVYYDSEGQKHIYHKVVSEQTYVKKVTGGTPVNSETEYTLSGDFQSTTFNYQNGDCGVFKGWYYDNGGEKVSVGSGTILTVSKPDGCCKRYRPEVKSCSDNYYPYGYFNGTDTYYRYALLPYINPSNGSWLTPSSSNVIIDSMDVRSIIGYGLDAQGYDNTYFKLDAGDIVYANGLLFLEYVNSTGSNAGNYKLISGRKLQKLLTNESVKSYKVIDTITNTTSSAHYYRIGYIELPAGLINDTFAKTNSYLNGIYDAVQSGEVYLYHNDVDANLNGMYYKNSIVYKNTCSMNKSAVILNCPSTTDFSQKLSLEEKYIDSGITVDLDGSDLVRYKKNYIRLSSGDYGYDTNVIDLTKMGTGLNNSFGVTGTTVGKNEARNPNETCNALKNTYDSYRLNTFDADYFGFNLTERIPVGQKLATRLYWNESTQQINQTTPDNTTTSGAYNNYPDNNDARSVNMINGKFICDRNLGIMALLNNDLSVDNYTSTLEYYRDTDSYNGYCHYALFDGGVSFNGSANDRIRLVSDNGSNYQYGSFIFGNHYSDTNSRGLWWSINSNTITSELSGFDTYHLEKYDNGSWVTYNCNRKYIKFSYDTQHNSMRNVDDINVRAYYLDTDNGWIEYEAIPLFMDISAMNGSNEVFVLKELRSGEPIPQGQYYVDDYYNGYNVIRPHNTQWPYNDDTLEEILDDSGTVYVLLQKLTSKNAGYYQLGFKEEANGNRMPQYQPLYEVSNAIELLNALDNEVRFIKITSTFNYNGVIYSHGYVYRLDVTNSTFNAGTGNVARNSASQIDYSLDNGDITIPVNYIMDQSEMNAEFYCTVDGYDRNGYFIGIPTLSSFCSCFKGTNDNSVFLNLMVDCANPDYYAGYYPDSNAGYTRQISYNAEYNYYQITKHGYRVGEDFVETPTDGYLWLTMADGGVKRKALNYLIDNITSEQNDSSTDGYEYYTLTAPLQKNTQEVLLKRAYDYVPYDGTPSSAVDIANYTAFITARDTNHSEYIRPTSDIFVHDYNYNQGACVKYEAGKYYKINANYYKTVTPSNFGSSDSGTVDLDFLGWVVESDATYEFYCDANGNSNGITYSFPISNEFVEISDDDLSDLDLSDYVYDEEIDWVYPVDNPNSYYMEVSSLNNYSVVQSELDLNDCIANCEPFKLDTYSGNDISPYTNGSYYLPNVYLLTTAFKQSYPLIRVPQYKTLNYQGIQYQDNRYFINTGVYSVIYGQKDVSRVLSRGNDYVMVSDYKPLDNIHSGSVTVHNVDELKRAIANRIEYIDIDCNTGYIHYRYMTYHDSEGYQLNSVSINGRTVYGGTVLVRKVNTNFISKEESVKLLSCENAITVYANSFKVEFCHVSGDCYNDGISHSDHSCTSVVYDGVPICWNGYGTSNFIFDHRHFTGNHKLSFVNIDSYTDDNGDTVIPSEYTETPSCSRMVGYREGQCVKYFVGNSVEIPQDAINDISTFVYGVLNGCGDTIAPAGTCKSKVITNNAPALFGMDSTGSDNPNYPYYNYLICYTSDTTNVTYVWDNNDNCYKRGSLPSGVNVNCVYTLDFPWADGAYALNRKISNGLYEVSIRKCTDIGISSLGTNDVVDFENSLTGNWVKGIQSFAPYLVTDDYVDNINEGFVCSGLSFKVEPNTLYKVSYRKVYDLNATLTNNEHLLQMFLCVYDHITGPFVGRQGYQTLSNGHWAGSNTVTVVTNTLELGLAIDRNVESFMIITDSSSYNTSLRYNGVEYDVYGYTDANNTLHVTNPFNVYGNIMYFSTNGNSILFGDCRRPIIKYISVVSAQLSAPTITQNGNTVTMSDTNSSVSGVSIHYTIDGSTPTASSATYNGAITMDGSSSPVPFKAIAVASGYTDSDVTTKSCTYILNNPVIVITY